VGFPGCTRRAARASFANVGRRICVQTRASPVTRRTEATLNTLPCEKSMPSRSPIAFLTRRPRRCSARALSAIAQSGCLSCGPASGWASMDLGPAGISCSRWRAMGLRGVRVHTQRQPPAARRQLGAAWTGRRRMILRLSLTCNHLCPAGWIVPLALATCAQEELCASTRSTPARFLKCHIRCYGRSAPSAPWPTPPARRRGVHAARRRDSGPDGCSGVCSGEANRVLQLLKRSAINGAAVLQSTEGYVPSLDRVLKAGGE